MRREHCAGGSLLWIRVWDFDGSLVVVVVVVTVGRSFFGNKKITHATTTHNHTNQLYFLFLFDCFPLILFFVF
jgi:hypothetical protein